MKAAKPTCAGIKATLIGTSKADVLRGTRGNDVIVGLGGNDKILGRGGNDTICPDGGKDKASGGTGDDWIYDGAGNDTNVGGLGFDTVTYFTSPASVNASLTTKKSTGNGTDSLAGFEALEGSSFDDFLFGDAKANFMYGGLGNDQIRGGDGFDTISFLFAPESVSVDLNSQTATGGEGADNLSEFEAIRGSDHNDILIGDAHGNFIYPGAGDDDIRGGGGSDTLSYYYSKFPVDIDMTTGSAVGDGTDTFTEFVSIEGSSYDDLLVGDDANNWIYGGAGNDDMRGGGGYDGATYFFSEAPVNVNLTTGSATGDGTDTLSGFSQMEGSRFDDVLTGDANHNWFYGGPGNDDFRGAGGFDGVSFIFSSGPVNANLGTGEATGEGNDVFADIEKLDGSSYGDVLTGDDLTNIIFANAGDDTIDGGGGIDIASFYWAPGPVTVDLATGIATGDGNDVLVAIEGIFGSAFDDILKGDGADNYIYGDLGDDQIDGAGAADFLEGGDGVDRLTGGDGNDNCFEGENNLSCEGNQAIPNLFSTEPAGVSGVSERRHF